MKFYRNAELKYELFGDEAIEFCRKCPHVWLENDVVTCAAGNEDVVIDEDTADSDNECWLP